MCGWCFLVTVYDSVVHKLFLIYLSSPLNGFELQNGVPGVCDKVRTMLGQSIQLQPLIFGCYRCLWPLENRSVSKVTSINLIFNSISDNGKICLNYSTFKWSLGALLLFPDSWQLSCITWIKIEPGIFLPWKYRVVLDHCQLMGSRFQPFSIGYLKINTFLVSFILFRIFYPH